METTFHGLGVTVVWVQEEWKKPRTSLFPFKIWVQVQEEWTNISRGLFRDSGLGLGFRKLGLGFRL